MIREKLKADRAVQLKREVAVLLVGGVDEAKHRPPLLNESDVDGKFTIYLYEFLCAVERIDEEEAALYVWTIAGGQLLLRHRWNPGGKLEQGFENEVLRCVVGIGDRRAVRLVPDILVRMVDVHDCGPGALSDRNDR